MNVKRSSIDIEPLLSDLRPVFERYQVQKVILFGSWARNEASRHSDIDLIIVQDTEKRFFDRYEGILYDLNRASKSGPVEILIYTPEELRSISHRPFVNQALREGRVIYESK